LDGECRFDAFIVLPTAAESMAQSGQRLASGSLETWGQASNVLAELADAGVDPESIVLLGLSRVFAGAPSQVSGFELPILEAGEPICCSSRSLAAEIGRSTDGNSNLEEALQQRLSAQQAERVATYVQQGKIVITVRLSKRGEERRVGLILLKRSSTPIEVHDLASSRW
jgi:hypothetical protein